ncbi:hypothetical protein [Brevundimonas sp. FT23028]|uniref:hypothetical protein n=1 Tax=Brevundimonas sp. FT23028 TaxID=3393748 RepID=UPI003B588BA3
MTIEATTGPSGAAVLEGEILHRLVPHAGAMRLLARVLSFDDDAILCEAESHAAPDNPLRSHDRLPITAGIEYAAQAASIHSGLVGGGGEPGRGGTLAVLTDVTWRVDRLDDVPGPLRVRAEQLARTAAALQYAFSVRTVGDESLIDGVLMIALA